jgi:EAL domain-containing protein (putative c-di-GMP-specific phosphodiesterase class I)
MLLPVSERDAEVSISRPSSKNVLANKTQSLSLGLRQDSAAESPKYSFDPRFYFPHFQPIVDIPSGKIFGYESLVRTYDQSGDIVSAGWIFEDDHIGDDIRLNIDRSVRQKSIHRFANDPDGGLLFINISPQWASMLEAGKEAPTIKMIRESGIDPSRIVIEITEKVVDVSLLESMVKVYRNAGLKLAIDDFGVGGSQVDRLIALKPDFIKIDMDIFKDASRNGESARVLLALSALSEQANFEIICEGVESEQEFHFAIECGAQKIQGWLFGKADGPLLKRDVTKDSVAFLQTMYLERKKELIIRTSERNNLIARYVNLIFEYHRQERIHELDSEVPCEAGLLRYYLCDIHGKQVSPNINFLDDGMWLDDEPVGSYWSHRPYFALAIALESREREQIVSNAYVDGPTKKLCKTTSMKLNSDTILLVDSIAFDDTLYCL